MKERVDEQVNTQEQWEVCIVSTESAVSFVKERLKEHPTYIPKHIVVHSLVNVIS